MGGTWKHRIVSYDPETNTAVCVACGPTYAHLRASGKYGVKCGVPLSGAEKDAPKPKPRDPRRKRATKSGYWARRKHRDAVGRCEAAGCPSVIVDPCQLDVDHIDGDYQNDDPSNWQVLCANCHRLKTHRPELL